MQTATQTVSVSKGRLWAGRAISALVILFLVVDGAMRLVKPAPVLQAFAKLGYPGSLAVGIGVLLARSCSQVISGAPLPRMSALATHGSATLCSRLM